MVTIRRLFISLIVLLGCSTGAWAIEQDSGGYYLIGSVQDWVDFANIVQNTNQGANAKMTADVDLGDDQTMVGTGTSWDNNGSGNIIYQGIFDGQGHTLTIHYNVTEDFAAPFRHIKNATIKNLHVDGTINTSGKLAAGIVGACFGQQINSYITRCISSVVITSTYVNTGGFYNGSQHGGIAAQLFYYGKLFISDCIFNGEINGETTGVVWGGFLGIPDGTITIENCLQVGTFDCSGIISGSNGSGTFSTIFSNGYASRVVLNNNYYLNQLGNAQGTKVTNEQLADGTTAAALQADRDEEIWVQDPVLGIPMLKIFANTEEVPVTDLSATATANTYIVSSAGKYKFKATVKGNGGLDPLTGTIATPIVPAEIAGVKVLWELGNTYGRAIKYEDGAYDISYSDGYVYFSTPNTFTTGVTCVAIYDSSDNILWSWDIWSTPEPGTVTYNGNTFMDRNLCAVDLNNNRGFLYQWGRKDAFSAATGSYASFNFVPTLFTAFNTVTGIQTIDYCIKHPTTHVNNGNDNSWMSREEYEKLPWRDNLKTIYDPCPAGWRVPTAAEQNGYSGLPGTGFSNAIDEFGNPGSGYYRSSTISSYPKAYAFRQNGQQNNWGTNPAFAIRPVKENVYLTYTVPSSGLGTFSADVNIIVPVGLTAYYCTTLKTYEDGHQGVRVSKLNGGIIPANTGVLFEGPAGQSYPLISTNIEAAAPTRNSLVAVVESQHIAATNGDYTNFMMKDGKFIKIADDDASMPAHRAYLPLLTSETAGAKAIGILWEDDTVTGISELPTDGRNASRNGNGTIYNLQGQKVDNPRHGIFIVNGKKVVIQ